MALGALVSALEEVAAIPNYKPSAKKAAGGKAYYNLITSGNNSVPGVTGFSASTSSPRYNQVTGLGSINGAVFVQSYTDTLPATSTALSSSASSLAVGQTLTLTATLGGSSPASATGTVQFTDNGVNLGAAVAVSTGVATLSTNALSTGAHNLAANYSGDKTHQPSTSATVKVSVLTGTTTSLSVTPSSIAIGQAVTLTASVAGNAPTGSVQFMDGGNALGAAVIGSNGVATFSTNQFGSVGTHTITATYSGDGANSPSSSSGTPVGINASNTSTSLSVSPSQAAAGQTVSLTASVTGFQPGGSVTFLDGNTSLGTVPLSNATATLNLSNLASGSHTLSASYAGDSRNQASSSSVLTLSITPPDTSPDGDVPTLPQWAALLLAALLGWQVWGRHQAQG